VVETLHAKSEQQAEGKDILRLFGGAPKPGVDESLLREIGPTRLAFWDCSLNAEWVDEMEKKNLMLTEVKMENSIDRIRGTAENPRNTERVPAGSIFDFNISIRIHDDEELADTLFRGLKLLELTGLGGSGSRGYGKVKIILDDNSLQKRLESINLEQAA